MQFDANCSEFERLPRVARSQIALTKTGRLWMHSSGQLHAMSAPPLECRVYSKTLLACRSIRTMKRLGGVAQLVRAAES